MSGADLPIIRIELVLVSADNLPRIAWELNLVLDAGSRLNVVDHGNLERLRENADRLAAFRGKPVWDGTEG